MSPDAEEFLRRPLVAEVARSGMKRLRSEVDLGLDQDVEIGGPGCKLPKAQTLDARVCSLFVPPES